MSQNEGYASKTPEELARLVATDKGAFDALYERLNGHVRTCAQRRLRTKKESVLDPVCAEVWWIVTKTKARFEGDSVTAWILGITGKVCLRYKSDKKKDLERRLPADDLAAMEDGAEPTDLAADVRHALEGLPPDQRKVLVLRFFRQLTFEEIEKKTGIPRTEVRRLLEAAFERLRPHLESWGPGESS